MQVKTMTDINMFGKQFYEQQNGLNSKNIE